MLRFKYFITLQKKLNLNTDMIKITLSKVRGTDYVHSIVI